MKNVKRAPLIIAHAENIPARIMKNSDFLKAFRAALGQRTGIYILYKADSAFYVGLARSLRGRIADHTRDHLRYKCDRFSLFVIRKEKYLKDIEALLIRAERPKANQTRPDFASHHNIKKELQRAVSKVADFDE
jgi:predicted GIY-YIG superfamily endonuclease